MSAKTKIAGLITTLMVLSVPMVYADNDAPDKDAMHEGGGWHHGNHDQMIAKIIGLTDDQQKQLKDMHQKLKDGMKTTFDQIKANREALDAEIIKASPDMDKVNDLQTQFKTIQSQMVDNHLNSILAIKKILTPEQFAGYMYLKKEEEMKEHMMMGHGKFGHKDGWDKDNHKHGDKDEDND